MHWGRLDLDAQAGGGVVERFCDSSFAELRLEAPSAALGAMPGLIEVIQRALAQTEAMRDGRHRKVTGQEGSEPPSPAGWGAAAGGGGGGGGGAEWECLACTMVNVGHHAVCATCFADRP